MIEVEVDSVRVSLMNQQRIVVLKDINNERFLPIWIDQFVAEAITLELQQTKQGRPMTHDLLKNTIEEMGGRVDHILVNDVRGDIYYARVVIEIDGKTIDIDSRPSDAIALAIRARAPLYVAEAVMEKSSLEPEEDVVLEDEEEEPEIERPTGETEEDVEEVDESQFSAFADFVNSLDLDELDDDDKQ